VCRSRGDAAAGAGTKARRAGAAVVVLVLLGIPVAAMAQSEFVEAVAQLRVAMQGAYGDEGQDLGRRIDDVSAALAAWDRSIRAEEARIGPRLASAAGGEAADLRSELGLLYLRRSRFADALAEFDAAARLAPERAALRLLRGFALDASGRSEAAGAAYLEAWTLEPTDPVKAYLALRRSAPAGPDLARLTETLVVTVRDTAAGVRRRPGVAFLEVPFRVEDASAGPKEPALRGPVFPLARYADGFAVFRRGQYEDAIAGWREAATRDPLIADPARSGPRMLEGLAAFRQGTLPAAIAAIEETAAALPSSSEAHRVLGTVLGVAGQRARSAAQLEAALRLRPDDERSWIALARRRAEAGSPEDVVRTLAAAVEAVPASGELRWRLAGSLARLERNGDALEQYAQAARLGAISGQGQVHQAEAVLATMHLDVPRTADALERRVRLNLNDAEAHRNLASVYAQQDRQVEAFAELAIAAWLDPADPLTFVALGHSHLAERRDADAVEAFQTAVRLAPDLRDARYALAQALTRVGRRDEGLQQLSEFDRLRREAAERAKRDDALAAVKAQARRQSLAGQHRQAAQTWIKVVAMEPALAQNYLDLAEAMVRSGALAASVQYFVKAAEFDGVSEVHLRLSEILGRLGRSRESALARATYERLQLEDFRRGAAR
jgi:tetratricopeptide (TPR) repeat protein